jgi:hypothetical protein
MDEIILNVTQDQLEGIIWALRNEGNELEKEHYLNDAREYWTLADDLRKQSREQVKNM